eukprot:TRINITY_DN11941_c0_g1_i1.p1 TRINITY_DN11941_c0_g1~~TRINITY_DN11941_c0_g1_i1.p1  ORF type:complete len:117 (-),score=15.10 TRINITY_DN11941_c0_g1_i1:64-414(-)
MELKITLSSSSNSAPKGAFSGLLPHSPTLKPMEDLDDSMSSLQLSPTSMRSGQSNAACSKPPLVPNMNIGVLKPLSCASMAFSEEMCQAPAKKISRCSRSYNELAGSSKSEDNAMC